MLCFGSGMPLTLAVKGGLAVPGRTVEIFGADLSRTEG